MSSASKLDEATWAKKMQEATLHGKLNISYLDIPAITPEQVAEIKSRIPNLVELDLRSNELTDLPDELAELRNLRNIRLNYNKLEHIPKVLTKLKRLTKLEMGGNLLRDVDEAVGDLPAALRDLDISGNRVQTVHPAMAKCMKLTYLNLENNLLVTLPEEMGEMENLSVLDLSNNQLASLPDTFGGLRSLTRIEVNNNRLKSLPPSMGHLTNLKDFDCRYNELEEPGKSKSEGPIAEFLEFLRDEEQRLIQEEIERLKPVATPVGHYLEYRMKIEGKGQNAGNGGPSDPLDDRPYLRAGNSLTWGANHLFIFGGALAYGDKRKTNDLFVTNLDRMVWHKKSESAGDRPCERDGHATVFDRARKRLLVFGGRSADKKRLNDLYAYDMVADKWTQLSPDGDKPAARENATMVLLNDTTAVLFGGKGQGQRYNDLHFLDLTGVHGAWSQPVCGGQVPSPRQDVALCAGDGKLYLHAGRDNFIREDMYALDYTDMKNLIWEEMATGGRKPPPCYGHDLAFVDGRLFTYGGFDELGGQILKVYRLDLSPVGGGNRLSSSGAVSTSAPEWVEMDSELKFNENRIGLISPDYSLHCLQMGSPNLGAVSFNSPEEMFWDVFKIADILEFGEKELKPEDLIPVNGKKMRVEHTTTSKGKEYDDRIRRRIIDNTPLEKKMLRYVNDFEEKFSEFYPRRRKLMLDPPNECGVRKFVCTTVRPSKLNYSELYDLEPCAAFVANYLEYEALENPILFPGSIPSPYTVMEWQAGDCFDLANVLCSLLLGVGYDAYVCVGYAPKFITVNDQSGTICPVLEREAAAKAAAAKAAAYGEKKVVKESKYRIKPVIDLTSKLDLEEERLESEAEAREAAKRLEKLRVQEEREEQRHAAEVAALEAAAVAEEAKEMKVAFASAEGEAPAEGEASPKGEVIAEGREAEVRAEAETPEVDLPVDPAEEEARVDRKLDGKRVHAWVVVRAGKREVEESIFIEPTTSRKYPIDASPYQGLECVWNHVNYWVNMQTGTQLGAPGKQIRGINFDLDNRKHWEACLEVEKIEIPIVEEEEEEEEEETAPVVQEEQPEAPAPVDGEGEVAATSADGDANTPVEGEEGEPAPEPEPEPEVDEYLDHNPDEVKVEMPPSWVPKLKISQENFDMMCPRGHKTTKYLKCTHEMFAVFGPCMRWDGMTLRMCIFEDEACTVLEEERQTFARRKDKLRERVSYPTRGGAKIERFDPGSAFGIREIYTEPDKERRIIFYPGARQDGLLTRHELFGQKMTETFASRDDYLVYRAVTYDTEETARQLAKAEDDAEAAYQAEIAAGKRRRKKKKVEPPPAVIAKVSKKFELPDLKALRAAADPDGPPVEPAHQRVRKLVFNLKQGTIRVDYHYGVGRVTTNQKIFYKDGTPHSVSQVDKPLPNHLELAEAFQAQRDAEKACVVDLRDAEKESEDIVKNRTKEEQNIELLTPYYDVVRINQEDDEEDEEEEKQTLDYLSPFLPPLLAGQDMSAKEAAATRDACLKALKDRLIDRANIIQARHDHETAVLAKRQANYQRDRDVLTREEEEEYDRACDESAFRLHILEQRMKRHEDQALTQYYELDARLKADPRMVNLFGNEQ
jgi:hypothetical protein